MKRIVLAIAAMMCLPGRSSAAPPLIVIDPSLAGNGSTAAPLHFDTLVDMRTKGAKGDGVTDDTAAFAAALATGRTVLCHSGDTYLLNSGLVATTPNQIIDMRGCKLKLKTGATGFGLLRLAGAGESVVGGEWDMNRAGNPPVLEGVNATPTGDQWAFKSMADHQTIDGVWVHDASGFGIFGEDVSYHTTKNSRFEECGNTAIRVSATTIDTTDVVVDDNTVTYTTAIYNSLHATHGILTFSFSPAVQRRVRVSNNRVYGPLAGAVEDTVAITVRGAESVTTGNIVRGTNTGISVDRSYPQMCVIANNNIQATNGPASLGIEVNGAYCAVTGNVVRSGKLGIKANLGQTVDLDHSWDHMAIAGNTVTDMSVEGITLNVGVGWTGHHVVIAGNTVQMTGGTGIRAILDAKFLLIEGNSIEGGGQFTGRCVFLDGVNSDVTVQGNVLRSCSRVVALNNASAVAQDRIVVRGNTISNVNGTGADVLHLEGLATYGVQDQIVGNFTGSTTLPTDDYTDVAHNVRVASMNIDSPEAVVTAGVGSTFTSRTTGLQFQKLNGTSTIGWIASGVTGGVAQHLASFTGPNGIGPSGVVEDATTINVAKTFRAATGYPITASYTGAAIGYGTWTAGYLLDEASGGLVPTYGSPTLTTNGGTRVYGITGPLGGADKAIGFGDNNASWDGAGNFDAGTGDLVVGFVGKFTGIPSNSPGATIIGKINTGATDGWSINTFQTPSPEIRICTGSACSKSAIITGGFDVNIWRAWVATIDRSTNTMAIASCPLSDGFATVSNLKDVTGVDATTSAPFRLGKSPWLPAEQNIQIAAMYIATGSNIATGLAANVGTASCNFASAISATTKLGATTVAGRATATTVQIGDSTGPVWSSGTGSPNGAVTGSPGYTYSNTSGGASTSFYVKESGSATTSGWNNLQDRVTGAAAAHAAIASINADGTVASSNFLDTAGTGLASSGAGDVHVALNGNASQSCGAGGAVTTLAAAGLIGCATFSTLTNTASSNIVMKSDGTNAVPSTITDTGSLISTSTAVTLGGKVTHNGASCLGAQCTANTPPTSVIGQGLVWDGTNYSPAPLVGVPASAWSPWQSGRYYHPQNGTTFSTAIGIQNTLRCYPFNIPNSITLIRMGAEISTVGETGSKLRLVLYSDDGTGRPGALVADAGQLDGTVLGTAELTISAAVTPGKYESCAVAQACATTCPTYRTAVGAAPAVDAGTSLPTANTLALGFTQTSVSGAAPNPFTGTTSTATLPPYFDLKVQ